MKQNMNKPAKSKLDGKIEEFMRKGRTRWGAAGWSINNHEGEELESELRKLFRWLANELQITTPKKGSISI